MQTNRREWEGFLLRLVERTDPNALSAFGTNLIYGGLITETANNSPRFRVIYISGNRPDQGQINSFRNILKQDLSEGRRICIVIGRGITDREMVKIYQIYSEIAFILIDSDSSAQSESRDSGHTLQNQRRPFTQSSAFSYSSPNTFCAQNLLYIPECNNKDCVNSISNQFLSGIAVFSPQNNRFIESLTTNNSNTAAEKGSDNVGYHNTPNNYIAEVFKFLTSPSLPILSNIEEFYYALCYIESIISGGKNSSPLICKI